MLRITELGYIMTPKQAARHNTAHFSSTGISISVFFKNLILHWENKLHECCEACGHVVIATINVCVYFFKVSNHLIKYLIRIYNGGFPLKILIKLIWELKQ